MVRASLKGFQDVVWSKEEVAEETNKNIQRTDRTIIYQADEGFCLVLLE